MNHTKWCTEKRLRELKEIQENEAVIGYKIVDPAWLYALNKETGEITEVEGIFWTTPVRNYFLVKGTDNFYENLPDEAKVYHSDRLWLSKQDKGQAAFIFGAHYQNKISKLVEEVDRLTDILGRIHN